MNKDCGIYKITSPTGKIYIGQSKNIRIRFRDYLKLKNVSKQYKLYDSFMEFGVENHQFDTIEYCELEDLNCSERFWQDEFKVIRSNGLNMKLTQCGEKRIEYTEEVRKKISDSKMGENNPMYDKEGELNSFFGKGHTNEQKQKWKQDRKNKNLCAEHSNSKIIIDTYTGDTFQCTKEASEKSGIPEYLLGRYLRGDVNNKSTFLYLEILYPELKKQVINRKVYNTETKVTYNSIKEAAEKSNLNYNTLSKYLRNIITNKTNLIYL